MQSDEFAAFVPALCKARDLIREAGQILKRDGATFAIACQGVTGADAFDLAKLNRTQDEIDYLWRSIDDWVGIEHTIQPGD